MTNENKPNKRILFLDDFYATPEGRMFLNMSMVLAEYERDLTITRVKDGIARAKSEGKPIV